MIYAPTLTEKSIVAGDLFVCGELNRYVSEMTGGGHDIVLKVIDDISYWDTRSSIDDAFSVDIKNGVGELCGSSQRALLIGVYHMLKSLGCRFLAPGKGGEIIPKCSIADFTLSYKKKASLRHRGICIEGAVSFENVLDMVDWLPKNGFNSYFIQFREAHTFFERWYTHEGSTLQTPEEYSVERSREYVERIEQEIKKRGLLYHKTGHGWTCECIGFPSTGWHKVEPESITDDIRPLLAEVKGKREFFNRIPLNTHLCYSNPQARRLFIDEVIKYCEENRDITFLHIWLADDYNNICECEKCRQFTQTDMYVEMLNEIDELLEQRKLDTKLVFLIYLELLWPAKEAKIKNPSRFLLMFAPISRNYLTPLYDEEDEFYKIRPTDIPEYEYNNTVFLPDGKEYLKNLFAWQEQFDGDSFDFDYHLMWDIYRDFGGINIAKMIYQDCKSLDKLGLNGFISCQLGRASFPSGFGQYLMGQVLFDNTLSFDDIKDEYFSSAFGESGETAFQYLKTISDGYTIPYMRHVEGVFAKEEYIAQFKRVKEYIDGVKSKIDQCYKDAVSTPYERAWKVLSIAVELHSHIVRAFIRMEEGSSPEKLKMRSESLKDMVSKAEMDIQSDLDGMYFNMLVSGFISQ